MAQQELTILGHSNNQPNPMYWSVYSMELEGLNLQALLPVEVADLYQ